MMVEWEGPGGSSGSRLVLNEAVDIGPLIDGTVVTFRALSGSPSYDGAVFAEVKTNLFTGGIALTNGAANISQKVGITRRRSARAGFGWVANNQAQTTFGGYTWSLLMKIPARAIGVRVAFDAIVASAVTIDGIAAAATQTYDASHAPVGSTFTVGTFNSGQASTLSIPAATGADLDATGVPRYWSDIIPIDALARTDSPADSPCVLLRAYSASTNTGTVGNGVTEDGTSAYAWQTRFRSGDYVTTAGGTTGSSFNGAGQTIPQTSPFAAVEFIFSDAPAISIAEFGDSIVMGLKDSPISLGPVKRAAALLQAANPSVVVSPMNFGKSGDRPDYYFKRARRLLQSGAGIPTVCFIRAYSRNTTPTVARAKLLLEQFIADCFAVNTTPVLVCGFYESSIPGNNANMSAINAVVRATAARHNLACVDLETVITAANAATMLDADGIHPSPAGTAAMAAAYAAVIDVAAIA